ncbi:MAG: hypothetical protein JW940_08905 [Polyangiaceae bacterium]|nr:hypothetical protein [Polyangiaceae bacterium]
MRRRLDGLAACGGTDEQQEPTTLTELIARADGLNHAIPTTDEIVSALQRLYRHGLVVAAGHAIALTDLGRQIHANGWARRGGLFSVVDNMQRALRSPRFEHRVVTEPTTITSRFHMPESSHE